MSTDYSFNELLEWNEKIEKIAQDLGLDYYPQEFEICSSEDMLGYMSYTGMPSHYPHWSFGKSYEKQATMHKYNLSGLPYEMVINSSPCLAYLMKDNTLLLQILTIAHVYGHNNFFKNNRLFKEGTKATETIGMFKNHADRIRNYISDPSIGYDKVEKILNAAHALKYNVSRVPNEKKLNRKQQIEKNTSQYHKINYEYSFLKGTEEKIELPNLSKIPLEPEDDLLYFLINYAPLNDWQRDILEIVREESLYFMPQIETKIMNEGWASYYHYKILNQLNLSQGLHFEFIKRHNQVIRPHPGSINPYYIGFKIFEWLDKQENGNKKIFEVRDVERDSSFLRKYLNYELCEEMNLFEYKLSGKDYLISEVSDESGWKEIRNALASQVGASSIPVITVTEWDRKNNKLFLNHTYDGREIEMTYAQNVLKHIFDIIGGEINLSAIINEENRRIYCDENRKSHFE